MLVLFFDTYIVAGSGSAGGLWENNAITNAISNVRDKLPLYKWQDKIDVVKYTLASYAEIEWDKVVIRFECEDKAETESFEKYCRNLFPDAVIETHRSATAKEYLSALTRLNVDEEAWIFFSPNNDHPYLANPVLLRQYVDDLDKFSNEKPGEEFGLLYSHFTESMLDNFMTDPLWGHFAFNFKKVIYENERLYVAKTNKAALSSCYLFKLKYLKKIFSATSNIGRVIRLEDTEFYLSRNFLFTAVIPKVELCRHYDGYYPLVDKVPPLFIPPGFFESEIKIRYGYETRLEGWVSLNPSEVFPCKNVDLPILLEDIPFFWKKRIATIDMNPNYASPADRLSLEFYINFNNPWHARPKIYNLLRSFYIYNILRPWAGVRSRFRPLSALRAILKYANSLSVWRCR